MCVENRTLENIPEISTPQHSLNLAESNNRLGGPGAKEQRNLNIDPQGPRTEAQRGEWMYLARKDGARKKRSFSYFHAIILTTHVFQNVAINSEAWGNKGSLIKIKFLPSGWNKIKINFKYGGKMRAYFVSGETLPATIT